MKDICSKFILSVILVFIGFSLYSCRPSPLDIDINPHDVKMVVASQVIPGQFMVVSLTKSFSALSDSKDSNGVKQDFVNTILISNALVTVTYDGQTDTLRKAASGIYISLNTLQKSYTTYTLHAKDSATGLEITSVSTMLPKVTFDSISPKITRTSKDTTVSMSYSFTDLPDDENYYVINYYLKYTDTTAANHDVNTVFNRGSNKILSDFDLLSDKAFNGQIYRKSGVLEGVKETDSIAVTITNISKGYFEYLTSYKRAGKIFNQLTGEPIDYPSNVNNGFGYFTTFFPDVHYFYLKEY